MPVISKAAANKTQLMLVSYLEDHFSFVLRYISVYHMRLLSNAAAQRKLISVAFCLTEDHRATVAATVNL